MGMVSNKTNVNNMCFHYNIVMTQHIVPNIVKLYNKIRFTIL